MVWQVSMTTARFSPSMSTLAFIAACSYCWTAVVAEQPAGVAMLATELPAVSPTLVLDAGGHTAAVNRVVWTRDGDSLISVSNDKTIRLWDVANGESVRVLRLPIGPGPSGMLNAAAISPDGAFLAVAGYEKEGQDHGIFLIGLPSGKLRHVLRGHSNVVLDLQFSRDGRWLASVSGDNSARVWAVPPALRGGSPPVVLQGHTAPVYGVAFSPDGRRVVTASLDGTARTWTLPAGVSQHVLRGHKGAVQCVTWSSDGRVIGTGGVDQSLRLWNTSGELQRRFENLGNVVTSVAISADMRDLFYTTGGPAAVDGGFLVNLATNRERVRFLKHDNSVLHGALSPNGQLAATAGGNNREILVWRTSQGELIHRLEGRGRTPWSVAWGADDASLVWGNTSREVSANDRGPLEQAFHLARLEFASPPSATQQARSKQGTLSLEQKGDTTVALRRDGRIQHTFKLTKPNELVRCYTLLSEHLVAIGGDYGLYLYSPITGGLVRELRGHTGSVWAVAPSYDGRFLASVAEDQTLCVWSPERDDPLMTLFFARGEWIAWTPEGYYAASPGGERLMGWHINHGPDKLATFHPAAQFRASLYRPDLIKLLLKNGSPQRGVVDGPKIDVARLLPPQVKITAPAASHNAQQSEIEVRATATSAGQHPVTALRLLLDGRPYQGLNGVLKIADPKLGDVSRSWQIALDPGRHKLTVLADSAVSQGTSEGVEVVYVGGASDEQVQLPKLYVVAVGVAEYPGDLRLNYAAKDAEALGSALKLHGKPLFREIEVQLITDQQATRSAMLKGLTWLRGQMTQNDYGIFFFAGHGDLDNDGTLYFLPVDADSKDLLSSAVPAEQVKRALSGIPGKLITIIDACHSAGIVGSKLGKRRGDAPLTDDLIRDLVTDESGVVAMCSSTGREFSLENNEHRQGTFTLAIIEGLSGKADFNKDGVIYLNELDTYVTDRVKELTRGQQHPVTAKPGNVRSFPLAKP